MRMPRCVRCATRLLHCLSDFLALMPSLYQSITDVYTRYSYSSLSPSFWSQTTRLCRLTLQEEAVFSPRHRCSDSLGLFVSPGFLPVESTGMTDCKAAAQVTGSSSISCTVPHQQAPPPDHRVPLPAPRCPPVPRRLLWHDSSGKKEEDQRLPGRHVGSNRSADRSDPPGEGTWHMTVWRRGYNHTWIINSCDTLLIPCRVFLFWLAASGGVRSGSVTEQRPWSWLMCSHFSRAGASWHQRDWTWILVSLDPAVRRPSPPVPSHSSCYSTEALFWFWFGPGAW